MIAAATYEDWLDEQAAHFDDTDGAYAIAEPDPFASVPMPVSGSAPVSAPGLGQGPREQALHSVQGQSATPLSHRRPSLRAELGSTPAAPIAGLSRPSVPPLPVAADLAPVLPHGLRRGSTIAVTSSVSLLLALIGSASAHGAWTALVGMPTISAEAATEAGVDLERLAVIRPPETGWNSASWATAVGALLDAVDIVVGRPGVTRSAGMTVTDGDARRLTARARGKDAVLMLFGQQATQWPAVETVLSAQHDHWSGIGDGYGRIAARRLTVSAKGKGRSARPRSAELWLPVGSVGSTGSVGSVGSTGATGAVGHRQDAAHTELFAEPQPLPDIGWAG